MKDWNIFDYLGALWSWGIVIGPPILAIVFWGEVSPAILVLWGVALLGYLCFGLSK